MALPKEKYREILFQLLYGYDQGKAKNEDMLHLLTNQLEVARSHVKQAQEQLLLILQKLPEIDSLIQKTSEGYAFERIHVVERNVLRLGIYELLYDEAVPSKVAITEAMRLARKFGSPESSKYVNAILDSIYKNSKGEAIDAASIAESIKLLHESEERLQDNLKQQEDENQ